MYVDELKQENLYFDRKRNHCDKASIKLLNRSLILISLFFKAAHATTTIHVYVHMYSTDVHHRWHPCDHGALNHTVASDFDLLVSGALCQFCRRKMDAGPRNYRTCIRQFQLESWSGPNIQPVRKL